MQFADPTGLGCMVRRVQTLGVATPTETWDRSNARVRAVNPRMTWL
jgi:hypothetical protein